MAAQRLYRVIIARQFSLGQAGVDLVVTDLMQPHHRPALAALEPWHKVMQALLRLRRDRSATERTDWIGTITHLITRAVTGKRLS